MERFIGRKLFNGLLVLFIFMGADLWGTQKPKDNEGCKKKRERRGAIFLGDSRVNRLVVQPAQMKPRDCDYDAKIIQERRGGISLGDSRKNSLSLPLHLHNAVWNGQLGVVVDLLKHGVPADQKNSNNQTPLHLAAAKGNLEMIMLLVESCVDWEDRVEFIIAKDSDGKTALDYVIEKGFKDCAKYLKKSIRCCCCMCW